MSSAEINNPIEITVEIDADATSGFDFTLPRALTIADVTVLANATNVGGTAQLSSGGNNISDAIACATGDAVARAATIDSTFATIASGGTLTITTNGAADRCTVTILCHAAGETI